MMSSGRLGAHALGVALSLAVFAPANTARADDEIVEEDEVDGVADRLKEVGSVSFLSSFVVRASAAFGGGTRPRWTSPATDYDSRMYGLEMQGSTEPWHTNPLGTPFAVEYHVGAFYSAESPALAGRDPIPAEIFGSLGLAGRLFALGSEMRLAAYVHGNVEAAWGGQRWWTDTPRLAPYVGPRLLLRLSDDVGAELDYSFVPTYLTGSPLDLDVHRWEHRMAASIGYGIFGLGVRQILASERTTTPYPEHTRTHAATTFVFLELRERE